MNTFKDKVIWITGASSGIGESLAIEFAKRGARLILSARREEELNRVLNSIAIGKVEYQIQLKQEVDKKKKDAQINH